MSYNAGPVSTFQTIMPMTTTKNAPSAHQSVVVATLMIFCMAGIMPCFSAVGNLRVVGVTNTQAVIAYTAPTTAACTVEVSETSDFASVVNDVNTTLFADSNLDSRAGSVSRGRERWFVAGNRRFDAASDGERYSRALQAATLYWARPNCGGDTAAISFTTASVPFGLTRPDPVYTVNPSSTTGKAWFPTRSLTDRDFCLIDPHSGVKICNLALPGDLSKEAGTSYFTFANTGLGTNWTNPNNLLASGSGTADYDGTNCSGLSTCDWLRVANTYTNYDTAERVDFIKIRLTGSGSDATAANRQVEVCMTYDDSTCDPLGESKIVTLPTSSGSVVAGTGLEGDWWRPTYQQRLTTSTWITAGGFKILLRKVTNVGTISIDYAELANARSLETRTGSGGNTDRCQTVADASGFYFCTGFQGNGASGAVYRIHGETGERRYLGSLPTVSVTGVGAEGCSSEYANWDNSTAGVFYCTVKGGLWKYTYTGNGVSKALRYTGQQSDWSTTALTGNAVNTIGPKVQSFTQAHPDKYPTEFDPAKLGCSYVGTHGTNHLMTCTRGNQDTYGWLAVLNSDGSAAIAAWEFFKHPFGRWCSIHSSEVIGNQPVFIIATQVLKEGVVGGGPYRTTISGAIDASTTTVVVASDTPTSSFADTTLYAMQVGDAFSIDDEWFRITGKSGTTLTVQRARNSTGAAPHSDGATVQMQCATPPGAAFEAWVAFLPTWDYVNDPYGEDQTGADTIWINPYNGHFTTRQHLAAAQPSFAIGTPGVNLYATTKIPSYNTSQSDNPNFAGVSAGNPGLTFQTHPSFHNVNEATPGRNYFLDVRPFVGGSSISRGTSGCTPTNANYPASNGCAVARVSGTSNIYKVTRAGNSTSEADYPTTAKYFPFYGKEGANRMYTWVSGPGITVTDSDHYKACWAVVANECVSGSSAGDVYVVVPSKTTYFYCAGGETSSNDNDTCVTPQSHQLSQVIQVGAVAPQRDNQYTRALAAMGLGMHNRDIAQTENTKALPSGKWAMATSYLRTQDVVLMRLPPVVVDSRNRSTWIPWPVPVVPPSGTDNIVVEFGYNTDFYCHEQRSEKCLAITAAIPTGQHPYRFPVEGTGGVESGLAGVSCSSSCTVNLPLIAGRVAYYRVRYRDSGGATLRTGPTQVVVVN